MTEKQEICQDCWGSGWETQLVTPCTSCKGTGKILPSPIQHQDGASAEDMLNQFLDAYPWKWSGKENAIKAMHQFAKIEIAKVVAKKDKSIVYWYDLFCRSNAEITQLQSELSTSNAHRARLIESVKKWGGAWRTCRAELKEAKRIIEGMEATIRLREERIMELTQYTHELKAK